MLTNRPKLARLIIIKGRETTMWEDDDSLWADYDEIDEPQYDDDDWGDCDHYDDF